MLLRCDRRRQCGPRYELLGARGMLAPSHLRKIPASITHGPGPASRILPSNWKSRATAAATRRKVRSSTACRFTHGTIAPVKSALPP